MLVVRFDEQHTKYHMRRSIEYFPLMKSAETTLEHWPEMSTVQKLGALSACLITTSRPLLRIMHERSLDGNQMTRNDVLIALGIDATDKLDGIVSRTTGGQTQFGGEYDALIDKVDFFIQEHSLFQNDKIGHEHLVIRFARDILVTMTRAYVMAETDGHANVSAGLAGKASTLVRQVSNRYTAWDTNFHDTSDERQLKTQLHQWGATAAVVASGVWNINHLIKEKTKYTK